MSSEPTEFPTPWRIYYTSRHKARGYNSHIIAANDLYVAERVTTDAVAQHIVKVVNEYDERRARLPAAGTQSAGPTESIEAVRARVDKALDSLVDAMSIAETLTLDHVIPMVIGLQIGNIQYLQALLRNTQTGDAESL